jgi:hypothetical protein
LDNIIRRANKYCFITNVNKIANNEDNKNNNNEENQYCIHDDERQMDINLIDIYVKMCQLLLDNNINCAYETEPNNIKLIELINAHRANLISPIIEDVTYLPKVLITLIVDT